MRVVAAVLLTLFVLASPLAWAAESEEGLPWHSAYADVPTDHWAYRAIESFRELGALDLWPEGYFSGEDIRSRYKFAQAIRYVCDFMSAQKSDSRANALLRALEWEFYDQLIAINPPRLWFGMKPDYDEETPPGPGQYEGVPGSAYADVPTDHWAYRAIESFCETGELEGCAEDFFSGDQIRMRYDFAQALCRLFSEMRERRCDSRTIAVLWALDAGFHDQFPDGSSWLWSEDHSDYLWGYWGRVMAPGGHEEVPTGHWAYSAVEGLRITGALDRYPANHFSGDPTLTRDEFSMVIQQLFDWFRRHGWDEETDELLTALEVEFYDQLSVTCEVALWSEEPSGSAGDLE